MAFTNEQKYWLALNGGYSVKGSSEAETDALRAKMLFDADQFSNLKERDELLKIIDRPNLSYSLDDLAKTASTKFKGYKEGGKEVTAGQEFLDAYFGNEATKGDRDEWRNRIESKYGKDGWENADKVMKQAYADKQQSKPKVGKAAQVLGTIFAPRSLEAWKAGKEASWKDIGLDVSENLLMALPITGWAGAGAKAMRLGKAGKIIGESLANAVVPHAMEALDASLYTPEENLDRSVYNESDALLGTATNIGAPFVLGRTVGRLGQFLGNKKAGTEGAKGLSEATLETLDNLVEKGEWVKPTQETIDAVKRFNHGKQAGARSEAAVGKEAADTYAKADRMGDSGNEVLEEGNQILDQLIDYVETGAKTGELDEAVVEDLSSRAVKKLNSARSKIKKSTKEMDKLTALQKEQIRTETSRARTNEAQDYIEAGLLQKRSQDLEGKSKGMGVTASELLDRLNPKEIGDILDFSKQLADADWMNKLHFQDPAKAKALDWGQQALESWAVNKYGSKRDATPVLGGVSNLVQSVAPDLNLQKDLQESRNRKVEAAEKKYKQSLASQVISNLDPKTLSADDKKYLDMVAKNPDVIKGFGEGNKPGFRNWYLLRGSDILRGTDLYRPTFEVE